MSTPGEKVIFGFLGAVTAVIFGIALYFSDFQAHLKNRSPASQEQIEYTPYPYFFD